MGTRLEKLAQSIEVCVGIDKIIRERRTVHSYTKEKVPDELIKRALELSIYAPNHKLTYPYLFVPVGPVARKKIADIAVRLKGNKEIVRNKFENEGSLIFFAQKKVSDEFTMKEDFASIACAIQNFSLFLWENGFGSKWSTGAIINSSETYEVLGINSNEYEIVGMVWAGQFLSIPKAPERPSVDNFIKAVP